LSDASFFRVVRSSLWHGVIPLLFGATLSAACGSENQPENDEESSPPPYYQTQPVPPDQGGAAQTETPPGPNGEGIDPNTVVSPPVVPPATPSGMQMPPSEMPPATLREAADTTGRLIGVALQARLLNDASYTNVATEFSSVTAENEMKWQSLEPRPNQFNFTQADRIVAFAEQNGMQVRGHTLVWHSQLPGWVSQLTTPEAVRSAMLGHIQTVVSRYRGRVFSWDVVNEAWQDNALELRPSVFREQLGDGFIDEAFIAARAADPDAKLYYNDYGTEGTSRKANAVFNMVQGMLARGVPIDGVGMQMHVDSSEGGPTVEQFASNMQRLVDLGLEVNISELDIATCGAGSVDERLQAQAQRAHGLVRACVSQPGCNFITVWGVADQYSWRRNSCEGGALPLLFDSSYQKKPAYTSVFDALMGR
jgi:endo-1,4-beta-xylanase